MIPIFLIYPREIKETFSLSYCLGKKTEGIISKKELVALNRIIESSAFPAAIVAMGSPKKKRAKKIPVNRGPKSCVKEKTTFYLSPETTNNLNKTEIKIRTAAKKKKLSRISRSRIVDQALSLILEDFAERGENSRLMRVI
jgi:hypothetical protein